MNMPAAGNKKQQCLAFTEEARGMIFRAFCLGFDLTFVIYAYHGPAHGRGGPSSFSLDEKEPKNQDKTICHAKAQSAPRFTGQPAVSIDDYLQQY